MPRLIALFLVAAAGFLPSGCALDDPKPDPNAKVSTMPWNRPEGWEGKGSFGGFAPGTQ